MSRARSGPLKLNTNAIELLLFIRIGAFGLEEGRGFLQPITRLFQLAFKQVNAGPGQIEGARKVLQAGCERPPPR